MSKKRDRFSGLTLFFIGAIFVLYLPLFIILLQAFLKNPHHFEEGFTTRWVSVLFEKGELWEPLLTSLRVALLAGTLSTILGSLGALGFHKIKETKMIHSLIVLPMVLPEVITGLSLLLFFLFLKIPLGFVTMVLAHASFSASFVFFIVLEQVKKLDPHLGEAGLDLGATPSQVFWQITLPNIFPGVISGFLLAFTISFDDFLISFFTGGAGVTTLPLKIYSMVRVGITPELNALSLIMICLSTLFILILLSKNKKTPWKFES